MLMKTNIYRFLYGGFVALGLVMLFRNEWMQGVSNLGIALVFDPFDREQPWKERPLWQRTWLIIHVGIVAAVFGYAVGFADR